MWFIYIYFQIHIVAYNSDVYANLSQALKAPRGVAIIAAFLQVNILHMHWIGLWSLILALHTCLSYTTKIA